MTRPAERALITQMLDALEHHTAIKHPQQIHYRDSAIEAAREYLAAPEQSEPICYASINKQGDVCSTLKQRDSWRTVPLYTHPAPKAEPVNQQLLDALKEVQRTLHDVNEAGGPITDTIWYSPYETLFDYIAVSIAAAEQAQGVKT